MISAFPSRPANPAAFSSSSTRTLPNPYFLQSPRIASLDNLLVFGTYRIVPIGTCVVPSLFPEGGEENASGSKARTLSVRFLNHGVRDDVDVEGGEGEVVVKSI